MSEPSLQYGARITGVGAGLPAKEMLNSEFEAFLDTNDEWIRTRTGIAARRICDRKKGENTLTMALDASKQALEMAGRKADEIDLVICGTVTPVSVMPTTANRIQGALGTRGFSFDLQAACSGFLYGLSIADQYLRSGHVKRAIVIGAENLSTVINWKDRTTAVLFGDGAGAVVVERTEDPERRVLGTRIYSDGTLGELLCIPHGYSAVPPWSAEYKTSQHTIRMQGRDVFKYAVRNMEEASRKVLADSGYGVEDVDCFLFHQANIRIIDAICKSLKVDKAKVPINLDRYGNTSAATLPLCLNDAWRANKVGENSLILMATFGGGLTWASGLMRL